MKLGSCSLHFLLAPLAYFVLSTFAADDDYDAAAIIHRDVVIVGGGSAGTYTAIQLQSLGKTVALVETLAQLGGNVNTYVDSATKETYDVGVVAYENLPVVTDYLDHLGVSFVKTSGSGHAPLYSNFQTGLRLKGSNVSSAALVTALKAYQRQLERYPYLINGYNLPSAIPSDLLLSWGKFIEKYNLQDLAYTVSTYNQGVGNILDQPTLYMLKYLDVGELNQLTTGVAVVTASKNNQEIYDAASAKLGQDAFVSTNVTSIKRSVKGVQVAVNTPSGRKTIQARQLVIAIRPLLGALQPFLDIRPDERALFAQWNSSYYWCGLVANTGLPANVSVTNANPDLAYSIPASPGLYSIGATTLTSGLHSVYFSSPYKQSDQAVQTSILATVARVRKGLGYPQAKEKPRVEYWRAHRPFFLTVSEDSIRKGFYTSLEALQGKYNTHWTGAAWQTEDSSAIWNYTKTVTVPKLLQSLACACTS